MILISTRLPELHVHLIWKTDKADWKRGESLVLSFTFMSCKWNISMSLPLVLFHEKKKMDALQLIVGFLDSLAFLCNLAQ